MELRTFDPDQIWQRMLDNVEFSQQTPGGAPREAWREASTLRAPIWRRSIS